VVDEPRPYREESDLDAMHRILVEGRAAGGPVYYVHVGDLNWWLYYSDTADDCRPWIYLWEKGPGGKALGWAFLSLADGTFDVFAHPSVSAAQRGRMLSWAEEQLAAALQSRGAKDLATLWISERDGAAIQHLVARGFTQTQDDYFCLARPLADVGGVAILPGEYEIRGLAGEQEAARRAFASHAAFGSRWPMDRYVARYLRFMRSPVYDPELDLVAVAPDGQVAAFCICWLDEANRVGHFEPVGTHPAFRRRGLARAVLQEGLRRMACRGMLTATVCVEGDNTAARSLYASLGMRPAHVLLSFVKEGTHYA
jgi:mycothiol synthase